MGTWGSGNFENDTAADFLSELTDEWIEAINEAMGSPEGLEPDEYTGVTVPCLVEILVTIAQKGFTGSQLPEPEVAQEWKKTYLEVWDGYIDELEPEEDYKIKRRECLSETFDSLIRLAKDRE